jgi:quinol monooxygenase YgiN
MMVFNATFLVTPGQEKHAEKILLAHVEEAEDEPGVLATRVYHSRSEPRRFFIYHELNDPAAFEAHRASRLYGGHILTELYSMLELESLLMDTYEPLEPLTLPADSSLSTGSSEERER